MLDFYEKRKIRSYLYSKVSIALLLMVALWLSVSVYERFKVEREMLAKRDEKVRELETLKERAAALASQVDHLKNERGIEEEIRNRFDVAKAGEQVVVIVEDEPKTSTSSAGGDFGKVPQGEDAGWFSWLHFW